MLNEKFKRHVEEKMSYLQAQINDRQTAELDRMYFIGRLEQLKQDMEKLEENNE